MAKRAKNRKSPVSAGSNAGKDRASPSQPRTHPYTRQLSRFYEPLVLLYTLGSTRGDRTPAPLPIQEHISHMPRKLLRQKFLGELAYMCDYDKGGETVTAIGLESTPQRYIFWVASNSCPRKKIVPFLGSLLVRLRNANATSPTTATNAADDIATDCIEFASQRIKKYKSHLSPLLRRCHEYLEREDASELAAWLKIWQDQWAPIDLCRFAYRERKSEYMQTLASLSTEPSYKTDAHAIHRAFGLIRHYIGRLGHHFRAADTLLTCSARLPELLHDFEVRSISNPPKSLLPLPDGKTQLDSIMVRMLPANSPDLRRYQEALALMDTKYGLLHRFLNNYCDQNLKPRVHAEVQVLEHFFSNDLSFADGDRFIGCSKPACFCCLLYFRHHPGHFVEPDSHRKIYLNWRPPDLPTGHGPVDQERRRDILNGMTKEIRKEALRHIDEKMPSHAWHPDSITGITKSFLDEQEQEFRSEVREPISPSERGAALQGYESESEDMRGFDAFLSPFSKVSGVDAKTDNESDKPDPVPQQFGLIVSNSSEDDSGEDGGVPI